jgi:tetratricopeptide (TPR) repeat protein
MAEFEKKFYRTAFEAKSAIEEYKEKIDLSEGKGKLILVYRCQLASAYS